MRDADLERIFTFWTGETSLNPGRIAALATIGATGLRHIHVSGAEVRDWERADMPFHPAYDLLSEVHKADYLRCYFMHVHGGGYTDIKFHTQSWREAVTALARHRRLVGAGYREVRGGTPYLESHIVDGDVHVLSHRASRWQARLATNAMRGLYPVMIGNGAFVFKPRTWFTRYWYGELCRRLDLLLPLLRAAPPLHARDRAGGVAGMPHAGYPVPWSFLLGDILGPLGLICAPALARSLPELSVKGYLE